MHCQHFSAENYKQIRTSASDKDSIIGSITVLPSIHIDHFMWWNHVAQPWLTARSGQKKFDAIYKSYIETRKRKNNFGEKHLCAKFASIVVSFWFLIYAGLTCTSLLNCRKPGVNPSISHLTEAYHFQRQPLNNDSYMRLIRYNKS